MRKRIVSIMLVLMAVVSLWAPTALAAGSTYYVYTENGGALNVRSAPNTGNNVVNSFPYGTKLDNVTMLGNGWAKVILSSSRGDNVVYVMSRYLVKNLPSSSTTPASTDASKAFAAINAEFRTAKKVAVPYTVISRPSRASGWVNLRWAPSTEAERIATCPQGKQLIVLVEMKNWYQVQDPETGMVGFISRKFVSVK